MVSPYGSLTGKMRVLCTPHPLKTSYFSKALLFSVTKIEMFVVLTTLLLLCVTFFTKKIATQKWRFLANLDANN